MDRCWTYYSRLLFNRKLTTVLHKKKRQWNMKRIVCYLFLLVFCFVDKSVALVGICHDDISTTRFHIIRCNYYTFDELLNEGVNTTIKQLEILHVPINKVKSLIKWYIRRHDFILPPKKTTFCTIAFSYSSTTPQNEPTSLSGLVVVPLVTENRPEKMLIYHRITASSRKIAPSNSIPIEAILSADNTICVFPDYFGCGVSENKNLPFISLNYHAKCATECALHALDIVRRMEIKLSDDFHTWTTGYSQGGGYAMATHKYIETNLPDSLSERINLRWSFCAGGIYSPHLLFENAIINNNLGSSPTIYLEGLRSILYGHPDCMNNIEIKDLLSENAIKLGVDTILQNNKDGYWSLNEAIGNNITSDKPSDIFSSNLIDTSSLLYKKIMHVLQLDDCVGNWEPDNPIIIYHSKKDNCIPYPHALLSYNSLASSTTNCILTTPKHNLSHSLTAIIYFAKILGIEENKLFKKLKNSTHQTPIKQELSKNTFLN